MRLNKYIAHSGVTSRRKADELIEKGLVTVNGAKAETGYDVCDGDVVEVDGNVIRPEKRMVYYILNKPTGYVTTVSDEQGRPTVMELVSDIGERIYPVGRLDMDTSGMLILTNDGDLAQNLMHPSKKVRKTYRALVSGLLTVAEARRLESGVLIDDKKTAPAEVDIISQNESVSEVEIRIFEGRKRQVRRMLESVGHRVIALDRIAIGNMKMAHLRQGQYRKLSNNEVKYLKSL